MQTIKKRSGSRWLAILASLQLLACLTIHAQTTTPNVKVDILGVGAEFLLGGDLTDPENDGLDELGAATDPTWNWKAITSSHEPDFEGGENSFNIFDNKVGGGNDKWCCDDPTADNPVWVDVEFPQAVSLTHFTVTSGNDTPDRDPTDWAIQGSNDGQTYTDIYRFFDTTVPWDERNQVVKFTLAVASPAYTHIRYIAYDTPGALHQINEIEYFGGAGVVVDTDKDGMPDSWEIQYGLNPNDATDAAKDCNNNGVTNLDEYKAGLDPCDATPPTLLSATTTGTFDTVRLTFSEELDPATATNTANYAISPSLAVTAAAYKSKVVTLTTAKQTPGATAYTVTVTGVQDLSKNKVAAGTKATFYSYLLTKTGVLKFSYWGNVANTDVGSLTGDPRYPATPDLVAAVFSFNSRDAFPDDTHENYGATIEGFVTPTESASYDFFLRSDDASQLFISTDATEANLVQQAEETGCCDAYHEAGLGDAETTQAPIALVAGKAYFVRLIYKEGGGGDYGQVAWRKTTDKTPAASLTPIPGKFLSSAVDLPAPAEGLFLTRTPAPNARSVSPATGVTIVHSDGKTAWTSSNVTLKFDGVAVTPTFTKDGNVATIVYTPSALLASKSTHTITLGYSDPGGNPATLEWSFEAIGSKGPVKDVVKGYDALLLVAAAQSTNKGGFSGADGDYAIDLTKAGGPLLVVDSNFLTALNAATATDELSVSMWIKKYDIAASSAFWFSSPSQGRVLQAHTPWSDNVIYFDTAGCCDTTTQRISANIDTFPGFTGDTTDTSWWQNWRLYVFTKKADVKQIYIDGTLFLEGSSSGVLSTDINQLLIAAETGPVNKMHGLVDDFAVYSKALTAANVTALKGGTKPSALPGTVGLLAYWDFNDATSPPPPSGPTVTATRSGNTITIQWSPAGGTLESTPALGPTATWTAVGAANPATITIGSSSGFYRVRK